MGTVVSATNLKGGVGKTSTCFHLAGTLARGGRTVLCIDADPQASLTAGFWGPERIRGITRAESVAALFDPALAPIPETMIRATGFDRVALVPGSRHLARANMTPPEQWAESEHGLADFVAEVRDQFDMILVDTAPNLYLCTHTALVGSDFVLIPTQSEDFGSQGLEPVQEAIAAVRAGPNPRLAFLGLLVTMFDKRLGVHGAYESLLRETYGPAVFTALFPRAKDYVEAVASRKPVSHYKPRSAAAKAVEQIAGEMLERIDRHAQDARRVA